MPPWRTAAADFCHLLKRGYAVGVYWHYRYVQLSLVPFRPSALEEP